MNSEEIKSSTRCLPRHPGSCEIECRWCRNLLYAFGFGRFGSYEAGERLVLRDAVKAEPHGGPNRSDISGLGVTPGPIGLRSSCDIHLCD